MLRWNGEKLGLFSSPTRGDEGSQQQRTLQLDILRVENTFLSYEMRGGKRRHFTLPVQMLSVDKTKTWFPKTDGIHFGKLRVND